MAKASTRSKGSSRRSGGRSTKRSGSSRAGSRGTTRRRSAPAGRSRSTTARKKTARPSTTPPASTRKKTTRASTAARRSTSARRGSAASARRREKDIFAVLMEDHREVEQMFARFEALGERAAKTKQTVVRNVIKELSRHAAAEEQILYPGVRRALSDGDRLADEAIAEHAEVKEALAALDKMSPDEDAFDATMQELIQNVRHHVQEEEGEMFPKLRAAMDADQLVTMGTMAGAAKSIAPTRPHPHAPSKPPANVIVGAVAGVADRLRDAGRQVLDR